MAQPSTTYAPGDPTSTVLYGVVRDHFETFRAQAASLRDGEGLPRFRCAACGLDRLVAFSCKGRGFCPRCGGRRMAERAAHLTDHVFPDVPVRQWVLSLPHRLRYVMAWVHDLCRAVSDQPPNRSRQRSISKSLILTGLGSWLAAPDDFRNWLVREAA